jgi:hypothetical protein
MTVRNTKGANENNRSFQALVGNRHLVAGVPRTNDPRSASRTSLIQRDIIPMGSRVANAQFIIDSSAFGLGL